MSRLWIAPALLAFAVGCGGDAKFEPKTFSDEEKAKIQAEDKQIADEESYGTAGKPKAPKKK